MPALRLVFLGSDPIALPLLNWFLGEGKSQAEVVAVFTQPDRPVGRGQQVVANGVKTWALAQGIPVLQPDKLTEEVRLQLAALKPDVSLVMAYGHILREAFIATPRLGTLNLHASILPKLRGASPIQTAVASGEKETGVSLMRIVRRLDAGPVADVERVPILAHDTADQIEEKLSQACEPLLQRCWQSLADESLVFNEQDESQTSYCRRLTKTDGALDFAANAKVLAARINGLYPWPGCTFELNGQVIKVGLAEAESDIETEVASIPNAAVRVTVPGEVLNPGAGAVRVATSEGIIRLLRLQRPGGKMLSADEFGRGFKMPVGVVIASREMAPLVEKEPFPYKK